MIIFRRDRGSRDRLQFRIGQLLDEKSFPFWGVRDKSLPSASCIVERLARAAN